MQILQDTNDPIHKHVGSLRLQNINDYMHSNCEACRAAVSSRMRDKLVLQLLARYIIIIARPHGLHRTDSKSFKAWNASAMCRLPLSVLKQALSSNSGEETVRIATLSLVIALIQNQQQDRNQ
jgi:hypothetical protein